MDASTLHGVTRKRQCQLLDYHQVKRLASVMEQDVPIHGTGNFPTLQIKPSEFVQVFYVKYFNQ